MLDAITQNELIITAITLACRVPAGGGDTVHKNRPSHGLAFNLSGEKIYIFGNKRLSVKDNDVIFLPENSDYVVEIVSPGDCYAINFKTSDKKAIEPFVLHIKNKSQITDLFASSERLFRTKDNGYMLKCKSNLYALLYALSEESRLGYASSSRRELLYPALRYIHEFYSERNFTVSFLSSLCGIKESYFRRIFLTCFGISPIKYINSLKLTRAKEILFQDEYGIDTVAKMSGFNNTYHFCRYFKKEVGMTPSEYRTASRTVTK